MNWPVFWCQERFKKETMLYLGTFSTWGFSLFEINAPQQPRPFRLHRNCDETSRWSLKSFFLCSLQFLILNSHSLNVRNWKINGYLTEPHELKPMCSCVGGGGVKLSLKPCLKLFLILSLQKCLSSKNFSSLRVDMLRQSLTESIDCNCNAQFNSIVFRSWQFESHVTIKQAVKQGIVDVRRYFFARDWRQMDKVKESCEYARVNFINMLTSSFL